MKSGLICLFLSVLVAVASASTVADRQVSRSKLRERAAAKVYLGGSTGAQPAAYGRNSPQPCSSGAYKSDGRCCPSYSQFTPPGGKKGCCESGKITNGGRVCCRSGATNSQNECCDSGVTSGKQCCPTAKVYFAGGKAQCCTSGTVTDNGKVCCQGGGRNGSCCPSGVDSYHSGAGCCPRDHPKSVYSGSHSYCCKSSRYGSSQCLKQ